MDEMFYTASKVAPRAGAWIETAILSARSVGLFVAPRAGAWIETRHLPYAQSCFSVAPRAGAWIETVGLVRI